MLPTSTEFPDLEQIFRRIRRELLYPVLLAMGMSVLTICGLVGYAAYSQNIISEEKSIDLVRSVVGNMKNNLGRLNYDYTYWDEAVEKLITNYDPIWARDNIGLYMAETFQVHSSFVLNEQNIVTYSMIDGEEKPGNPFALFTQDIMVLVEQARAAATPEGYPIPAIDFVTDGTQVFIISASALTTYTYDNGKVNNLPTDSVVLLLEALSDEKLRELSENYALKGLEVGLFPEQPASGMVSYDLVTQTGQQLAYLSWQPDNPASKMLQWLIPAMLALFTLLTFVIYVFVGRANQVARTLITEMEYKHEAEKGLIQAQKMISLGNLAGGISHNLNNLIQPIMALSHRLEKGLPTGSTDQKSASIISNASVRAAELIKKLMFFKHQEAVSNDLVDVCGIIEETLALMKTTIPENVHLKVELDNKTGFVAANATQLQTVLINLVSNAVHALEDKDGDITIGLSTLEAGEVKSGPELEKNQPAMALIRVSDTGAGIDEETQRRIFDPFFTTRPQGKGMGLGLSSAYAIVADLGGTIKCSSQLNAGTQFEVRLPLAAPTRAVTD